LALGPHHWTSEKLGDALYEKGAFTDALPAYQDAVRLNPNCPTGQCGFAKTLSRLGKVREAIAAYDQAIRIKDDLDEAHNGLAWLLATAADTTLRSSARAVELGKRAVELDPSDGTYWNTLGIAHWRAGDPKSARDALEKSMSLRAGGDAYDWFFLAMAHHKLGDTDQAKKWHDSAVAWTQRNKPADEELLRFRTESAQLLGIKE
jgi:tetratricopeptide (TPR) repeat protein